MKTQFSEMYLSWRLSQGLSRIMVGILNIAGNDLNFKYMKEAFSDAKKQHFTGYPGLPLSDSIYTDTLSLFDKRLINTERADSKLLLDFWSIPFEYREDKIYLLAMTQGKMQTDNFEFLAKFKLTSGMKFVTDIAGIGYHGFDLSRLSIGDELEFECEENNKHDSQAVRVLYKGTLIGYIKRGHNEVFHEEGSQNIRIKVKHIINKSYKELYIEIEVPT